MTRSNALAGMSSSWGCGGGGGSLGGSVAATFDLELEGGEQAGGAPAQHEDERDAEHGARHPGGGLEVPAEHVDAVLDPAQQLVEHRDHGGTRERAGDAVDAADD